MTSQELNNSRTLVVSKKDLTNSFSSSDGTGKERRMLLVLHVSPRA